MGWWSSSVGKIGAAVGAAVGVALVLTGVGAPLGTALIGMSLAAAAVGAAITYATIGFVVGGLLGGWMDTLTPDLPSSTYDGAFPTPTLETGKPIAEAYGGPLAIAGNVVRTNDPSQDVDVKMVLAHCLGPVEEYIATFVNKREFSTLEGTHYNAHGYGEANQLPLKITKTTLIYSQNDGIYYNVIRTIQEVSATLPFFTDYILALRGLAHSIYNFDKNSKHIGQAIPSVVEVIKSRRLIPISINGIENELTWSRNIADVLWDYYRRYDKGSIISDKLIGFWSFNESTGTTAADSSGYNNNGTLTGFAGTYWVAAQVGNGLLFDGDNSLVNCGNLVPLDRIGTSNFAISFKVNFTSITTGDVIFSKYQNSSNLIQIYFSGTNLRVYSVKLGQTIISGNFNTEFETGVDYHIVFIFDKLNLTISMFVNKIKDSVEVGYNQNADISNTGDIVWGASSNSFHGILDQARIYHNKSFGFKEVFDWYEEGVLDENSFKSLQVYAAEYPEDSSGSPMRPIGPNYYTVRASSQDGQYISKREPFSWIRKILGREADPTTQTFTEQSSTYGEYSATYAFDITKDLTGRSSNNSWNSKYIIPRFTPPPLPPFPGERISCDLAIPVVLRKLELVNSTENLNRGVNTFLIQASNSASDFIDTDYDESGTTWVTLGSVRTAAQHDANSPVQTFEVTGSVPYRYYSLKIISTHGDISVNIRDICFYGIHQRFPFDFVFDNVINKNDAKKLLFSAFNGRVFRSQGKLKVGWEGSVEPDGSGGVQDKSVVLDFTLDNIISISRKKPVRYNKIKINYINSHEQFKHDYVEDVDEVDMEQRGEILFEQECNFIYHQQIARSRARTFLKKAMYCDWTCIVQGTDEASKVELFDLVSITYAKFGWTEKQFIVIKKVEDWIGRTTLYCDAYYSGIYDDEESPAPESYFSRLAQTLNTPATVEDLALADSSYFDEQGSYISQAEVTYTLPNDLLYFSHLKYQYGFKIAGDVLSTSGESSYVYMQPSNYALVNKGDFLITSGETVTVFEKLDDNVVLVGKSLLLSGETSEYVNMYDYPGKDTGAGYFTIDGRNLNLEIDDDLYIRAISVNTLGVESGLISPYATFAKVAPNFIDLQTAITSGKKRILVPPGIYSGEYSFPDADIVLEGVSKADVIFRNFSGEDLFTIHNRTSNYIFKNFTVESTNSGEASKMFNIYGDTIPQNKSNVLIDELKFNCHKQGSYLDYAVFADKGEGSLLVKNCEINSGEVYGLSYKNVSAFNNISNGAYVVGANRYAFNFRYSTSMNLLENQCFNGGIRCERPYQKVEVNKNIVILNDVVANELVSSSAEGIDVYTPVIYADDCSISVEGNFVSIIASPSLLATGISVKNFTSAIGAVVNNNIVDLNIGSFCYVKGIYFGTVNGAANSNVIKVNAVSGENINGLYAYSARSTINSNTINMVNNTVLDIGIIFPVNADNNKGTDNLTYNAGTSIDDSGTGNDVLAKDI